MIKFLLFTFYFIFTNAQFEGCLVFSSEDKCEYCKVGYEYNSTQKSCSICPEGTYSEGGTNKCEFCYNYNYCSSIENEEQRKMKCPYYSSTKGSSSCDICSNNKFVDIFHKKCLPCLDNCLECSLNENIVKCTRCSIGFGLDKSQQECIECDESLGEYSDGTTPCYSQLNNDVFLMTVQRNENEEIIDTFYTYKFCSKNCLRCNVDVCIECIEGATLNENNECIMNSNQQQTIVTNAEEKCNKTAGDISFGDKCFVCHSVIEHCSNCTTINEKEITVRCSQCQEPFVLKNGQCVSCEKNYHYENGNCVLNIFGCNYQIENKCYDCQEGFILQNGKCHVIETCESFNERTCEICLDNTGISSNGECNEFENCKYSYNNECLICNDNYQINNNKQCIEFTDCVANYEEYCLKTNIKYHVNVETGKLTTCLNDAEVCITPNSTEKITYGITKDQFDLRCKEEWYLSKESLTCEQSNKVNDLNQIDDSIQSKCIKTKNSDCIKCYDGYFMMNGSCQKITNNNCVKQIYGYCNNLTVNCSEKQQSDPNLQYCLQCEINDNVQYIPYKGGCKSLQEFGNDYGCETFDKDKNKTFKERCHCKTDHLIDSLGCKPVTHNCIDFSFDTNKCNECLENNYKWMNECYSCDHQKLNELCYVIKTDDNDGENNQNNVNQPTAKKNTMKTNSETSNDNKNEIQYGDISSCYAFASSGCERCNEGYILNDEKCVKCITDQCTKCSYINITTIEESQRNNYKYIDKDKGIVEKCFKCQTGYTLDDNNKCRTDEELKQKCFTMMPSGGCAICKDKYYRTGVSCESCHESCAKCNQPDSCNDCAPNYFMDDFSKKKDMFCHPYKELTNCTKPSQEGCKECQKGYYLSVTRCEKCHTNCTICLSSDICSECSDGFIFANRNKNKCVNHTDVAHCTSSNRTTRLCGSCEEGYRLSEDKFECEEIPPDYFLLIGVPMISVFFFIVFIIIFVSSSVLIVKARKKDEELRKKFALYQLKDVDIKFEELENGILADKQELDFNKLIPDGEYGLDVDSEHSVELALGFKGKGRIKIQVTTKEDNDKVEIDVQPPLITMKKGHGCKFYIKLKALCTINFEDEITITCVLMKTSDSVIIPMKMKFISKLSTKLDPDELEEHKKLGEGSFGIVYLGNYRGNKVAIKKMKDLGITSSTPINNTGKDDNSEKATKKYSSKTSNKETSKITNKSEKSKEILEFEKEVAMLDKFRNEYIIHFYGAVIIPNKICMVTEFAPYGSLDDLIYKKKYEVNDSMRVKLCLDGAYGIQYLHDNGILHRDIKPDNFLVISIEPDVKVNCKLTDFGASRNINMLMTNMMFTKGVGTPAYMAPEILTRSIYKHSADIYSFAITMLEVITFSSPFPKEVFEFPWDIADLISDGKRPDTIQKVEIEEMKDIIEKCWSHDPQDRPQIKEVTIMIENVYRKYNPNNL